MMQDRFPDSPRHSSLGHTQVLVFFLDVERENAAQLFSILELFPPPQALSSLNTRGYIPEGPVNLKTLKLSLTHLSTFNQSSK